MVEFYILFIIVISVLSYIIYYLQAMLKEAKREIKYFNHKIVEWNSTLESQSNKINTIIDSLSVVSVDLADGEDYTSIDTYYVDKDLGLIKINSETDKKD